MNAQHTATPRPWKRVSDGEKHFIIKADGESGNTVCAVFDKANADFIVRAVNSHDDLLAVLKQIRKDISIANMYRRINKGLEQDIRGMIDDAIKKAEA